MLAAGRVCREGRPVAGKAGLGGSDDDKCRACCICFTQCPAKAIDLTVGSEDDIERRIHVALSAETGMVEFGCWYSQSRVAPEAGFIALPCTSRLSTRLLLHAFEAGAEKVYVAVCSEDDDGRFVHGHRQTRTAVAEAQKALKEIGMEPELIELGLVPEKKCMKSA